jgi:Tfp pilus assembly protein PilN
MIKINLLEEVKVSGEEREKIGIGRKAVEPDEKRKNIIFGVEVAIALAIVIIWYFALNNKLNTLTNQKIEKQAELRKVENLIKEVDKFRAQKAMLEKQINLIEELKMRQKGPADLMMKLYEILPDQVALKKLKQERDTISLTGEALNDPALSNFYKALDTSDHFIEIEPGKNIKTRKGINFDLSCTFLIDPVAYAQKQKEANKKRRTGAPSPNVKR